MVFNPQVKPNQDPSFLKYSQGVDVPANIKQQGQEPTSIQPQGAKFEVTPYKGAEYEGNKHVDESGLYAGKAALYEGQAKEFEGIAGGYAGKAKQYEGISQQYAGEAAGAGLKAEAIGVAALGDLIGDAVNATNIVVKGADFLYKKHIDDAAHTAIDREREGFTAALQQVAGSPPSILGKDEKQTPEDIKRGLARASTMAQSYEGGHVSKSLYFSNLKAIATDLRNQYPAYKDYIDKEISQYSGVDPANAYMQSLISDINHAGSAKKEKVDRDEQYFKRYPGIISPEDLIAYKAGKEGASSMDLYGKIHRYEKMELDTKMKMAQFGLEEKGRESKAAIGQDVLTTRGHALAANTMETMEWGAGARNPKQTTELIDKWAAGDVKFQPGEADQLGSQLQAQVLHMKKDLYDLAYKPQPDGSTIAGTFKTPAALNAHIDGIVNPYQEYVNFIKDEKLGPASEVSRQVKAEQNGSVQRLLSSNLKDRLLRLHALDSMAPNFMKEWGPAYLTDKNLGADTAAYVNDKKTDAVVQSDIRKNGPAGQPVTLKNTIEDALQKGLENPNVQKSFLDPIKLATDPKTPSEAKRGVFTYLFDSENKGVIDKFQMDTINRQGQHVPGKYFVYSEMTSPEMSTAVAGEAKTSPVIAAKYANFAASEFGILFREELNNLNQNPTMFRNVDVEWNPKSIQFEFKEKPASATNPYQQKQAIDTIQRINWGLRGLNSAISTMPDADSNKVISEMLTKIKGSQPQLRSIADRFIDYINTPAPKSIFAQ